MGSTMKDDWKLWVKPKKFRLKPHTDDSEAGGLGISWETLAWANLAETAFDTSDRRTRMESKKELTVEFKMPFLFRLNQISTSL